MDNDDRLRALYRNAATAAGVADGSHPDEAAWERLACQQASAEERARLLEHMIGCAQCADIYRAIMAVRTEARQFDPGVPVPARTGGGVWPFGRGRAVPPRYWPVTLAASVVIVAALTALFWRTWTNSPTEPAATQAPIAGVPAPPLRSLAAFRLDKAPVVLSPALVLTPRGSSDDRQRLLDALGAALVPYRADDFPEAARQLEPLARAYPDVVEPNLYAGVAVLLSGRAAESLPYLERARAIGPPEFQEEIDWRLGLASVHADRPQAATAPLQRVCAGRGQYSARACEAVQALTAGK